MKLNPYQWDSAGRGRARGTTEGVQAERLHGGVSIKVTIGGTYMGVDLTTEQADDLAKFLIEHGIAERAAVPTDGEGAARIPGRASSSESGARSMSMPDLDALLTEADPVLAYKPITADELDSYLKGARPGEQELAVMVPVHVVARAVAALRSVQVPVTEEWEYATFGGPDLTAATHRRRKAGPWEPVPTRESAVTND